MVPDAHARAHGQSAYEEPRQQVWNMSPGPHPAPHNGLLHSVEHAAAAAAATASSSVSGPVESGSALDSIVSTYNATLGAINSTISHANEAANSTEAENDAQPPEGHRPIYYLSRGFPFICLAIVLLLAWHRFVIYLRHKRRISRRKVEDQHRHTRLAADDPAEAGGAESPEGSIHRSEATLVGSLPSKGVRSSSSGEVEDTLLQHGTEGGRGTRRGRISRHWSAWEATQRNWLYLRTIPGWLYGPESMADAMWTGTYTVVMIAFALATIPQGNEFWYLYLANGMGVLAFCQCPLIIVLIQKNNPISALTGITYQKLNYLHRASSRVALFFSWAHMLLWTPRVWVAGHFRRWYIIWGLIAIFGFTGLWITSFRFVRRVAFEFFLVAHIIFTIVFIGGAILHWYRLQFWLWPCFAIWALDRLIRGCKMLWINPPARFRWFKTRASGRQAGECTIELLGKDVMLLTARRPELRWTAGQHFFLSCPSVSTSPHETHPFSIANMPNDRDEAVFLIRVHSGFTRRLRDNLSGTITTDIPVFLEGPYGSSHPLSSYSTVVLIAGGTGITFLSSNLLGLLQPSLPAIPRHLHLVWHIRHASDVKWLAGILNEAATLAHAQPWVKLTLDIHVTKSGRSDEPAPAVGFTDRLVEEFAPRRFSHRYSVHRERGYWSLPKLEGGLSELPSAVGSDDEGEEAAEEDEVRRTRDAGALSTATVEDNEVADAGHDTLRRETASLDSPASEADDEVDRLGAETGGGENEDEEALLPKPITRPHRGSPARRVERGTGVGVDRPIVVDSTGLTEQAAAHVFWKKGRADLREVLEGDLDTTTGPINVTVCGPVQLMHAARRAVRDVATPERARKGDWPVDFYEETLGS